ESLANLRGSEPRDLDLLACRGLSRDDPHAWRRHAERLGKQRFDGRIRLALLRGRADPHFQRIAQPAGDTVARRTGHHLHLQATQNTPPNREPTAAVAAMAKMPQKVTRAEPLSMLAPPARAASAPVQASAM